MDIKITEEDLRLAYAKLNAYLSQAQSALELLQKEKDSLEEKINHAILIGAIEGKNEGERKASIAHQFGDGQEYVRARQLDYDRSRTDVLMAENNVAMLRAILRLYEVAKAFEE